MADYYLRKHGEELKKGRLTLSDEMFEYLLLYTWLGNLRRSPPRCGAWSRWPSRTRR